MESPHKDGGETKQSSSSSSGGGYIVLPPRTILKVLWPYCRPQRRVIALALVCMTVASITNVLIPLQGKEMIDVVHQQSGGGGVGVVGAGVRDAAIDVAAAGEGMKNIKAEMMSIRSTSGSDTSHAYASALAHELTRRCAVLVTLVVVFHAVSCAGHLLSYRVGLRVSSGMIAASVHSLGAVPWESTLQQNPAEYAQTLVQASRFAGDTVAQCVTDLYPSVIAVVGFFCMVLYISPMLTALFSVVGLAMQLFQRWRASHINVDAAAVGQDEARMLAIVTNAIQRGAMIRLFDCQDFVQDTLTRASQRAIKSADHLNFAIHSNAAVVSGVTNALFVTIVALMSYYRGASGAFTMTDMALFFFYMSQLLNRAVSIGNELQRVTTLLQRTTPFVLLVQRCSQQEATRLMKSSDDKRSNNLLIDNASSSSRINILPLDGMPAKTHRGGAVPGGLASGEPAIIMKGVDFAYGGLSSSSASSSSASSLSLSLRDVTLSIPKGAFAGLVGASGGGKTTTLRLMAGLLHPTNGTVQVRERVVMLEQGGSVLVGTIEENIRVGRPDASLADVQQAVQRSGCSGFIGQLPNGLQTMIGNIDVCGLSGGQLQRICLARVFLSRANIVIFDEPTTGLDVRSAELFYETAMQLRREGRTIILVTHDHALVRDADVVFGFRGGQIIARGRYQENAQILRDLHDHH